MYYKPDKKYFTIDEFFPNEFIQNEINNSRSLNEIWRLMDWRIVWTIEEIRKYFKKPIVINDYMWGGNNKYRGFRPFENLVDVTQVGYNGYLKPTFSSFTSQHCLGRAIDSKMVDVSAEEIREDIKLNPTVKRYKYITAVEETVSWLHIDCRSWNKTKSGILFFEG